MRKNYILKGIVMLIPLIGFLFGIILLRKGIKRKDRVLSYIGLGGIVFSIGFYSFVFYYGTQSQTAQDGEIMFTQYQLNHAIQAIEFYYLNKEHYPDSLQQLYSLDKYAPIIDPMSQKWFSRKFSFFNYKKIGETHYTIFSSGKDMIPYTPDDVYPDKYYFETNKTGYISEPN